MGDGGEVETRDRRGLPEAAGSRRGRLLAFGLGVLLASCRADPPPRRPPPADLAVPSAVDAGAASPGSTLDIDADRDAITLALAREPDSPEKLADAADLYLNRLSLSHVHSEIGLLYARRGRDRLERRLTAAGPPAKGRSKAAPAGRLRREDQTLLGRLSLLESQALLDLGRSREALRRIDADAGQPWSVGGEYEPDLRYERAVALFELCQLADARRAFESWLSRYPRDQQVPWAHHHLGLTLEMLGEGAAADRELTLARQLEPQKFPAPLSVSSAEFRHLVDVEAAGLPAESAADLKQVSLETSDLPDLADLTVEEPPLSPTILGLFRGLPAGEEPSEPRAIVLYRKNLLRAVRSREELIKEIRTTLLHELGHLRGADDDDLRERGLE